MHTVDKKTGSFIESVYEKADQYFKSKASGGYASPLFFIKSIFLLLLYGAAYYCFLFESTSIGLLFGSAVLLGVCHVLIPVNIAHDAIHGAISEQAWLNRLGSYALEITGANSYIYGKKHLEAHYNKENGQTAGSSISSQGLLLQTKKKKATVNLPYIYYACYAQYMIFVRDFVLLSQFSEKVPEREFAKLCVSKLIYSIAFLVVPFVFIPAPWWQILAALMLMYFLVTVLLVVILLMPTEKMQSSKMSEQNSYNGKWSMEVLEHNVDFSPGSRLLNYLVGGTNLNVVHYLFPNVNHIHYNHLASLIENTAKEYGLLYRKQEVKDVFGIHLKYLRHIEDNPSELPVTAK